MRSFKPAKASSELPPEGRSTVSSRQLRLLLVSSLISVNVLVCLLAINSLLNSKALHEATAKSMTQNIAHAIDLNISRDVQKADLALHSVVDELEHELSEQGLSQAKVGKMLAALEQRIPEIEAIRVAQADGLVIMGKGVDVREGVSWADRPSFRFLRDHPGSGLQIFGPVVGLVSNRYVIGFSRRFDNPDGSFAGVISAPISVDYFTSLLSNFDVGPNGSLILRNANLDLISRWPPLPNNPAGRIGNQVVSEDFRKSFETGQSTGTNLTSASPDGVQRMFTFRRSSTAPVVIIAATAQSDYLVTWTAAVYRTAALYVVFLLLTCLMVAYLLRLLTMKDEHLRRIDEGKRFVVNILDSLTANIVVIDAAGVITAVNESWRRFAADNGAADSAQVCIGANYLAVCSGVNDLSFQGDAQSAYVGIRSVLEGKLKEYRHEYACHSPTEQRWFLIHVLPLSGSAPGAVISHQNVTQIHLVQDDLRVSEDKFRMIAQNTSDGVIVFDASQRITYVSPAYLQQLGYRESEELLRTPDGIYGLIHAEDRDQVFASVYAAMQEEAGDLLYTYRVRRQDGRFIWREDHARFVYDGSGAMNMVYVICRDISARKAEEEHRQFMSERLQELSRRLVLAQEHARHHLARELHELTSPNLAALSINLCLLDKATPAERGLEDFADRVADTRALIDDTTSSIRGICTELHSSVLEGGGMVGVVQNYAQHFARRTGLNVTVHCDHEETHLVPALALPLFRIIQEALTNSAKHAKAKNVNIRLQLQSLPMHLEVQDDGIGFDLNEMTGVPRSGGLGMMNMRETAEFVSGKLSVCSRAGAGTTVSVDIAAAMKESVS